MTKLKQHTISIKVSMTTAFVGGILTPALETVRRWHQMRDLHYFMLWFDDYLIGGILIIAAWKTYRSLLTGQKFLIAAWGIATGMMFCSFFGQLEKIEQPDPANVPGSAVLIIKAGMFVICVVCLFLSLQNSRHVKKEKI